MNYNIFSSNFPVLEGDAICLRALESSDMEELHRLLQDPVVVKEYWAHSTAPTYKETRAIYSLNPLLNYSNKKSITWAVALKESGKIIGLRDLFVDDAYKPVTVQGFVEEDYRGEGISKEAYRLILDFARKNEVVGLLTNTNAENTAAVALLCSVGFATEYLTYRAEDVRLVLGHDLREYKPPLFGTKEEKTIYRFCRMYLQSEEISISPDGYMQRDGARWPCYRVAVYARNRLEHAWSEATFSTIEFVSDGVAVLDLNRSGWISYLDSSVPIISALLYCWERCRS